MNTLENVTAATADEVRAAASWIHPGFKLAGFLDGVSFLDARQLLRDAGAVPQSAGFWKLGTTFYALNINRVDVVVPAVAS